MDYLAQPRPGSLGMPPAKPGTRLKFTVVDPSSGNRSSTWSVFTGKKKDDVYLLEVTSGGTWKTSHHNEWGKWQIGMTSEASKVQGFDRQVINQWPRPIPEDGWSEGVTVLIPCAHLQRWDDKVSDGTVQIPISPSHSAVYVRLAFEEPGTKSLMKSDAGFLVGVLGRPNGGLVWVVAEPMSLSTEQHESIASFVREARSFNDKSHPGRFVGVLSVEGHRVKVDLSLD